MKKQREKAEREALAFQPVSVDESKCLALLYNHGRGRLQCDKVRTPGQKYCGMHCKGRAHGDVRGPIPAEKLQLFMDKALKPEKASSQWYARHLMWACALEDNPAIENLQDLDMGQYENCLKKLNLLHRQTIQRFKGRLERGVGVRDVADRVAEKFGSERKRYNGRGGGSRV